MAPLLRGTPNSADPKPAFGLEQRILIKRWRKYGLEARKAGLRTVYATS